MNPTEHEHDFEPAVLLTISAGIAWVPARAVTVNGEPAEPTPGAFLCACGEQGYPI